MTSQPGDSGPRSLFDTAARLPTNGTRLTFSLSQCLDTPSCHRRSSHFAQLHANRSDFAAALQLRPGQRGCGPAVRDRARHHGLSWRIVAAERLRCPRANMPLVFYCLVNTYSYRQSRKVVQSADGTWYILTSFLLNCPGLYAYAYRLLSWFSRFG